MTREYSYLPCCHSVVLGDQFLYLHVGEILLSRFAYHDLKPMLTNYCYVCLLGSRIDRGPNVHTYPSQDTQALSLMCMRTFGAVFTPYVVWR